MSETAESAEEARQRINEAFDKLSEDDRELFLAGFLEQHHADDLAAEGFVGAAVFHVMRWAHLWGLVPGDET